MYLAALNEKNEHRRSYRDFHIERTRQFMALFANANRGRNQKAYKPQDFWLTSYDQVSTGEAPTPEVFEEIVNKYGKQRKKKK